jgi:hypothetical protein
VVFLEKAAAFTQIPLDLTLSRHPGFMLPPDKIYLVSDLIAPNCDRSLATDRALQRILLHEMGHAIEFIALGERHGDSDRERAEGFATWFEFYAHGEPEQLAAEYRAVLGVRAGMPVPMVSELGAFRGTREDYLRAALRVQAIVTKRGISSLMQVYSVVREKRVSFNAAVEESTGWDSATLARQIEGIVNR